MNILSLFDGISCAQVALERCNIKVDNYFASEINKHAIKVTQHNYPNTIQLGDVTKIKAENLPKIDLLVGGSPCQGFSNCGKGLNFNDSRSKLFFEYVRILKECKPKYFLLENVKMKQEWQDIISEYLNVEPILINSALVSAQSRPRLYWTNISDIQQPKDKNILLQDIIDIKSNYEFIPDWESISREYKDGYVHFDFRKPIEPSQWAREKAIYLNSKFTTLTAGDISRILCDDNRIRRITILEQERLQTLSDNYTSIISVSQRHKALGNCFTIDVIAHILKNIKSNENNVANCDLAEQLSSADMLI